MNVLILIPARYASTRFPGKPLAEIGGKPMIQHVVEKAQLVSQDAFVATDDQRIYDRVVGFGGKVVMTSADHKSGTDRCCEAYRHIVADYRKTYDVVVNIQGDEPFIQPDQVRALIACFEDPRIQIATLAKQFDTNADIFDPNKVKVVCSSLQTALYFSRSAIPYCRGKEQGEANRIGYELASRFLKGKHAFIVATHTDREHIHNHIIYNSTTLDGTRKFRDFFFSGLAVQRLSDLICLEHQLSVIEKKPYRERQKRITYPPKESNRDRLCSVIDEILQQKPTDYEDFLQKLEQQGYEIKRGKYTSVKGARQKRFIRLKTLGAGYSEDEIKAVIAGKAEHRPHQKQPPKEQPFQLLVDIQAKLAEGKGGGYERWAKKYNLKEMSKTLIFLQEQKIGSADDLKERADAALSRYHKLGDSIKAAEKRMAEIAVLRAHIVNYAKTRPVYDAYRKSGYSSKFLEAHREEVTLHKTAKAAFNESGLKKLPKVKDLNAEYSALLTKKKALYPEYRKTRDEMQEIVKAQKNVELFFAEEKDSKQVEQIR